MKEKNGCGPLALAAFGSVFLIAGLLIFWYAFLRPMIEWNAAKSWPTTNGTITHAKVEEHSGDDGTSYSAEFKYVYTVAGVDYDNDRYKFIEQTGGRPHAQKLVAAHPVGSKTPIFYNPEKPAESVMNRDVGWEFLFGLLPLIFIVVGGGIVGAGLYTAWSSRSQAAHGGLPESNSSRNDNANQTALAASDSREYLRHNHPADKLDQELDGPLKLKPEMSRLALFIGVACACLFWNGIVSIISYSMWSDGVSVFIALFMVPFILIGLGLIGGTFYVFLSLFNPKIEIALSSGAVGLGTEFDVAWEVAGNANRFRKLTISIEGEELATYQQGTDRRTDAETFKRIEVIAATDIQQMQFGTAVIKIPDDTMHTFASDNNEIKWSVKVHGDIPWWPDVNQKLQFRVKPG